MAGCYALVGSSIGLRFSRDIMIYAARVFPKIAASTLTLIALCGDLAILLHLIAGTDPLTAYLPTSPGGADIATASASTSIRQPALLMLAQCRVPLNSESPTRVECPLTFARKRDGIPIHYATRLKIGAMLPGFSGPPICV